MFSYQRCVDGLDLVFLKRSEARHLAAEVRVNQHLRWKNKLVIVGYNWRGKQPHYVITPPQWSKLWEK